MIRRSKTENSNEKIIIFGFKFMPVSSLKFIQMNKIKKQKLISANVFKDYGTAELVKNMRNINHRITYLRVRPFRNFKTGSGPL